MKFSHTMPTRAPEKIWKVWTDVAGWKRWDYKLEYSKIDGPFRAGTRGVMKSSRAKEVSFIIEHADKKSLTIAVGLPLAKLRINRKITGRTFTHETSFEGPLGFAYGLVFGGRFRRELPIVMGKVRKIAESN